MHFQWKNWWSFYISFEGFFKKKSSQLKNVVSRKKKKWSLFPSQVTLPVFTFQLKLLVQFFTIFFSESKIQVSRQNPLVWHGRHLFWRLQVNCILSIYCQVIGLLNSIKQSQLDYHIWNYRSVISIEWSSDLTKKWFEIFFFKLPRAYFRSNFF